MGALSFIQVLYLIHLLFIILDSAAKLFIYYNN